MKGSESYQPGGTRTEVSASAAQILATPIGKALFMAAMQALDWYDLKPRGSETLDELKQRVALLFMEFEAFRWQGPVNANTVFENSSLEQTVSSVSPSSTKGVKKFDWWTYAALGAVGLLVAWALWPKKKGAPSVL